MPISGGSRRGVGGHAAGRHGAAPVAPSSQGPSPKILIAGVDRDERWPIEAAVRRALPQRAGELWTVSLVRLGGQWSVTIDGPGAKQRSLTADADGLESAIREAVGSPAGDEAGGQAAGGQAARAQAAAGNAARAQAGGQAARAQAAGGHAARAQVAESPAVGDPSSSAAWRAESRVEHECPSCHQAFVVVYDARPQEPKVLAAVACPHCWQIDRVEIGEWAASGHDYRAVTA